MANESSQPATELLEAYLDDFRFFAESCLKIKDKQAQLIPLRLNSAQTVAHDKITAQWRDRGRVRAIVLKARQEGISTYVAGRNYRRVVLLPRQNALVIADVDKRSKTLFDIYDRFDKQMPEELRPEKRSARQQTLLWYDVDTKARKTGREGLDSRVSVETAKDVDAGRSATFQAIHASEVAAWDKPEDTMLSLMQTLPDVGSELILESTAQGVGNYFHEMWEEAVAGENGFIPIFLPWWIHEEYTVQELTEDQREAILSTLSEFEGDALHNGILFEGERHRLTLEQLAWRRQTIRDKHKRDERSFRQEYPATPEEAFLVSGNCFFEEDQLAKYLRHARTPLIRCNLARRQGGIVPAKAEFGHLRIWEWPKHRALDPIPAKYSDHVYVIAADTSEGKMIARERGFSDPDAEKGGRDFSSADVFDATTRTLVAQLHARIPPETFAEQLWMLGYLYSCPGPPDSRSVRRPALIAPEKNHSSGETVIRILKEKYNYPSIYRSRQMNRLRNRPVTQMGWLTTMETRQPMLDELAEAIRDESIDIPCAETIKEMFTFVTPEDGKPAGQEGTHDDRVISLAIALQVSHHGLTYFSPPRGGAPKPIVVTDTPTGVFEY